LRLEPALAATVREVIVMGGAAFQRGNASPVAEANLRGDPEAAAIVLAAPWPVVMVGLDVTNQVVMDDDYLAELAAVGNPRTDFIARILPVYRRFCRDRYQQESQLPPYVADGVPTHDPSAVAYAIDPALFQTARLPLWVQTEGRAAGQTVPDPHHWWGEAPEVSVCLGVQAERLMDLYLQRLRG
jgi:purine nucleosidase